MVSYPNNITGPVTITGGGTADTWTVTGTSTLNAVNASGILAVSGSHGSLSTATFTNTTTNTGNGTVLVTEAASGSRSFDIKVAGDTNARYLVLGDGTTSWGTGASGTDTTLGRAASGVVYTPSNLLVGSNTALGDNGAGELQLADVTTAPTTNPTGGSVIYSTSAAATPLLLRDTSGNIRSVMDGIAYATADQSHTGDTVQTNSTFLTLPVVANAVYALWAVIIFNINNAASTYNVSWAGPSGATLQWADTTGSVAGNDFITTIGGLNPYTGQTTDRLGQFGGILVISGTPGNFVNTFNTSNAASTSIIRKGSYIRLTRIR